MKTIKTMMKTLLALILLLAVAPCALPAYAEEALPPLSGLSLYEPDAEEDTAILATEPPQEGGTGELADFQLREAVYDEEYAYLVVDVTPKQELLLIAPGYGPEDPMHLLMGDSANSLTIGEYAEQNDLQMAYVTISSALDALGEEFIHSQCLG